MTNKYFIKKLLKNVSYLGNKCIYLAQIWQGISNTDVVRLI